MMRNFPAQAMLLKNWSLYVSLFRTCHPPWIITNPDEGPCCEMVKKKPPACRLPTKFAKKKPKRQAQKIFGRWKKWPPSFLPPFFFWWPRVLREKNGLRFFMFSSWKIRSMQHVNHECEDNVKPQSFIFTPPSFKPWRGSGLNFWPDRTAGFLNF